MTFKDLLDAAIAVYDLNYRSTMEKPVVARSAEDNFKFEVTGIEETDKEIVLWIDDDDPITDKGDTK